jgi:hypothetical protein
MNNKLINFIVILVAKKQPKQHLFEKTLLKQYLHLAFWKQKIHTI